jgi:hypothetical protein
VTVAGAVASALGLSDPRGVLGTDVVDTGVVGAGVVGTGVVGAGVVGTGVVGTGVVGTGVVGAGVDVGSAEEDLVGRVRDPDACGVALARATKALPPLAPAMCVAATGLCRGRPLGPALWVAAAGGTTDG